ncbi:MAG: FAD-dependent oxidoreductase, partial [Patescibacteria group bacterium]
MSKVEDVIIIGSGPAGLAAAVYNSRASLNPLVFGGAPYGGQLMLTSDVENYPGFESVLGPELIEKMRAHAKKFGSNIIDKNITKVDFSKKPFELYSSEEKHLSKAVIITTGAKAIWLNLESETRLRGKGVSACATCDGFFFKDKEIAVVGGGDSAMEEALYLTKFASKIYIIHRRDEFRASQIMQDRVKKHPKIEILWNTEVEEVLGKEKVEGIKLKKTPPVIPAEAGIQSGLDPHLHGDDKVGSGDDNGAVGDDKKEFRVLPVSGVFIAIGHKPDTDVFKGEIELDE